MRDVLAENVAELMGNRSQKELEAASAMAGEKIDQSVFSRILKRDRGVSIDKLPAIAKALRTTPADLVTDRSKHHVKQAPADYARPNAQLMSLQDLWPLLSDTQQRLLVNMAKEMARAAQPPDQPTGGDTGEIRSDRDAQSGKRQMN